MNYGFNDDKEKVEVLAKAEAFPKSDIVVLTTEEKNINGGSVGYWDINSTTLANYGISDIKNYIVLGVSSEQIYSSSTPDPDNTIEFQSRKKAASQNLNYPMAYITKTDNSLMVAEFNQHETVHRYKCKVVLIKVA